MSLSRPLLVLVAALVAAGCAPQVNTSSRVDPAADFSGYQTWTWMPPDAPVEAPELPHGGYISAADEQRVVRAMEAELAAKGYRKVASLGEADLVVAYAVGSGQKTITRPVAGRSTTYYPGFGRGTATWEPTQEIRTFEEGVLVVDVYDRMQRRMVWTGAGKKRLTRSDDSKERLRNTVATILAPLPGRSQPVSRPR
jgi:hypothetical protein